MNTETVNVSSKEADEQAITEPVMPDELQSLIAAVTPENVHHEVAFSLPVGNETL